MLILVVFIEGFKLTVLSFRIAKKKKIDLLKIDVL